MISKAELAAELSCPYDLFRRLLRQLEGLDFNLHTGYRKLLTEGEADTIRRHVRGHIIKSQRKP